MEGNRTMVAPDTPPDREPAIRMIAMPADANPSGDIFGGYIMSLMDLAGGAVAFERAGGRVAIVATGRTSIVTRVEAWVRRRAGGRQVKVTEGELTDVKIGDDKRPVALPRC